MTYRLASENIEDVLDAGDRIEMPDCLCGPKQPPESEFGAACMDDELGDAGQMEGASEAVAEFDEARFREQLLFLRQEHGRIARAGRITRWTLLLAWGVSLLLVLFLDRWRLLSIPSLIACTAAIVWFEASFVSRLSERLEEVTAIIEFRQEQLGEDCEVGQP